MSDHLNPAQREAVNTLSGPLLVLAGAGSGKTRVVTHRIAELIRHGTPPERILAVTFTNKAAAEMQQRAAALLGKRLPQRPEISTFHSLCVRVLRRQIQQLDYPQQFTICDRHEQESIARAVLREISVPNESLRPGDLLYFIGRWKTASVDPQQASSLAQTDKEHLAAAAYRRYQKTLKARGAVDFDDLLVLTQEIFARFPAARKAEAARFSQLLIDEYQDTNENQYRIVKALAAEHRNLCVVGDDDQSIYGWRGAEVAHILRFKHDWPEAKVVRLEDNYRSTAEILGLANKLILFNRTRHEKVLRAARPGGEKPRILQCQDETDEARQVVADLQSRLRAPGAQPRDFAILFRTNEQPRPFEMELRRVGLPYVLVGGMSFYDRKEVRDIVAYLKLLVAPHDESALLRVVNNPPRGIGQATVTALLAQAVRASKPLWEVLRGGRDEGRGTRDEEGAGGQRPEAREVTNDLSAAEKSKVNPATADAIRKFQAMILRYQEQLKHDAPVEVASALIQEIGYRRELARVYKDPDEEQSRWAAVEEVVNALGRYQQRSKRPRLAEFLDEIALGDREDADEKESQLARNAIALMTLHSAKGLEFPQVFLVGLEEGLLPHHRAVTDGGAAIEEERRLCYVGITRAQDRLTLSLALGRMKWGKSRPTDPSRFLFELTGQAEDRGRKPEARGRGKQNGVHEALTSGNRSRQRSK
ncbi:MAG TPA: UvrD-helicase domain-containing protein [Pirellulales bacterium]|jgi:DNA helicase-2/ATP-dependent DNA helicase PcrA|nr:UvrD-helicase domain-containing protein [Pirellulales bacterium]